MATYVHPRLQCPSSTFATTREWGQGLLLQAYVARIYFLVRHKSHRRVLAQKPWHVLEIYAFKLGNLLAQ
eukprot:scaffold1026_cov409-Prasinococcus_capsulatus_cf.AAC.1